MNDKAIRDILIAWLQATAVKEQKEIIFRQPVQERTAHDIPYTDIEVSLGAP